MYTCLGKETSKAPQALLQARTAERTCPSAPLHRFLHCVYPLQSPPCINRACLACYLFLHPPSQRCVGLKFYLLLWSQHIYGASEALYQWPFAGEGSVSPTAWFSSASKSAASKHGWFALQWYKSHGKNDARSGPTKFKPELLRFALSPKKKRKKKKSRWNCTDLSLCLDFFREYLMPSVLRAFWV